MKKSCRLMSAVSCLVLLSGSVFATADEVSPGASQGCTTGNCGQQCPTACATSTLPAPGGGCSACVQAIVSICVREYAVTYGNPPSSCPTAKLAMFPQGGGMTMCMWLLTNCGDDLAMGYTFGACGDPSTCENGVCTPPATSPTPTVEPGPGMDFVDETPLTKEATAGPPRTKTLHINKKPPGIVVAVPGPLVAPNPDTLMPALGTEDAHVKFIKVIRTKPRPSGGWEYFALYKAYLIDKNNPDGYQDLETDRYIGLRVAPTSTYDTIGFGAGNIEKLPSFRLDSDPIGVTRVREIAVRTNLPAQFGSGDPKKWFHVFGVSDL